jgi:hypothetical protein
MRADGQSPFGLVKVQGNIITLWFASHKLSSLLLTATSIDAILTDINGLLFVCYVLFVVAYTIKATLAHFEKETAYF